MAQDHHVCPWWLMYFHPTFLRKWIQPPEKILGAIVNQGQTILDVGCGFGYFSIPMAKMIGDTGRIIAADLQPQMLKGARRRANRAGVAGRITFHQCESERIGYKGRVDGILAFYVVHEVPDKVKFFKELRSILKPGGFLLISEPKSHVSEEAFEKTIVLAKSIGFKLTKSIKIARSRTRLLSV